MMRSWALMICWCLGLWSLALPLAAQLRDTIGLRADMAAIHQQAGGQYMHWAIVGREGRLMGETFGADVHDRFRAGSLGKVIVALGIQQLVADGKLRLDDPVAKHLPDLKLDNPWESTDPVRIVHLLEHSSGLDDMHFNEYFADDKRQNLKTALATHPRANRIRWRPGTCSAYSNIGYAIAAHILEVYSGVRFDQWLNAEVLVPAGLTQTYFEMGCDDVVAHPCEWVIPGRKGMQALPFRPFLLAPSVGLVTTAGDLAKLVQLFLCAGRVNGRSVLDSTALARMYQHESTPAHAPQWRQGARGLGFNLWGPASDPMVRASGFVDGYISQIGFLPQHGYGWVLLANATDDDAQFIGRISARLDRCLPNARNYPRAGNEASMHAAPPLGHYRYVNRRNALYDFAEDLYGGLDLEAAGETGHYLGQRWQGGTEEFAVIGDDIMDWDAADGPVAQIGKSADGHDFLMLGERYYQYDPSPWPTVLGAAFDLYRYLAYAGLLMLIATMIGRLFQKKFALGTLYISLWTCLPFWYGKMAFSLLQSADVYDLGRISVSAVGLLVLTVLIPIATLAAFWPFWRRRLQGAAKLWKWMHFPLLLGNLGFTAYLVAYGMIPFASWLY